MTRRAQSYSDFHDAVKAVLGQDVVPKGVAKETAKDDAKTEEKSITSELDFADWYNGLEHELLDSSHDDYVLVMLKEISEISVLRTSTGTIRDNWNYLSRTWTLYSQIHPQRLIY